MMKDARYSPQRELCIAKNTTHSLSKHRHYPKWRDMMNRCYSPKNKHYSDYGGRGIVVCDEWKTNVADFVAWCVSQEPITTGFSLDRFPNQSGPYSPTNCRFASPTQQNRNMRSNIWIEHEGERLIFKDFVERFGVVKYETAKGRVLHHGWDRKEAALTPAKERRPA